MHEISLISDVSKINFSPDTIEEEVLQNVKTILTTVKYSVPLDREFGISATMLDDPMPVAQAKLSAEIVMAIRRWEPRARVVEVKYEGDGMDGILRPKVRLEINAT